MLTELPLSATNDVVGPEFCLLEEVIIFGVVAEERTTPLQLAKRVRCVPAAMSMSVPDFPRTNLLFAPPNFPLSAGVGIFK
jgi:hypothetical protein